jgi:hypothetical protein
VRKASQTHADQSQPKKRARGGITHQLESIRRAARVSDVIRALIAVRADCGVSAPSQLRLVTRKNHPSSALYARRVLSLTPTATVSRHCQRFCSLPEFALMPPTASIKKGHAGVVRVLLDAGASACAHLLRRHTAADRCSQRRRRRLNARHAALCVAFAMAQYPRLAGSRRGWRRRSWRARQAQRSQGVGASCRHGDGTQTGQSLHNRGHLMHWCRLCVFRDVCD